MTGTGSERGCEIVLLAGTMKGAFIFHSDASRKEWRMEGPRFRGESVYSLFHDVRGGRDRTFAAATNPHWGGTIRTSDDRVMNEKGEIRQHVNLFVDEENIRFIDGLDSRVGDGSTLFILAAISGG